MPRPPQLLPIELKHPMPSNTALMKRPERPSKYANSVTLPDGSLRYDTQHENYFDTSTVSQLLPSQPPSKLYDTVARAYDNGRVRSLAKVISSDTDHMGISPLALEWRPNRSSYEDLRGAQGVSPTKINTIVPPQSPPVDVEMSPTFKAWLVEHEQLLEKAKADLKASTESNPATDSCQPSTTEDDFTFDYDSDSSLEIRIPVPRAPTPPPQPEKSDSESDPYGWDSDSDSEEEYTYKYTPHELCDGDPDRMRWLIFPKRPSVEPDDMEDLTRKRCRGGKTGKPHFTKTPKRDIDDTPIRRSKRINARSPLDSEPGSSSSPGKVPSVERGSIVASTAMELDNVRIESRHASPMVDSQPSTPSSSKPSKPYRCLLDGCNQAFVSSGSLNRHQQSLRHSSPSHPCSACGNSFTRLDALKRHLNSYPSCKKLHTSKPSGDADGEPIQTEAN